MSGGISAVVVIVAIAESAFSLAMQVPDAAVRSGVRVQCPVDPHILVHLVTATLGSLAMPRAAALFLARPSSAENEGIARLHEVI